jgi:hypothetical protein
MSWLRSVFTDRQVLVMLPVGELASLSRRAASPGHSPRRSCGVLAAA